MNYIGQSTWRKLNLNYAFEDHLRFRQRSMRAEGFQMEGVVWEKVMSPWRGNNAG